MKLLSISIIIVILGSCVQKQEATKDVKEINNTGYAKFEFQEEFYNFGKLKAGEVVLYTFQFKNVGESSLKITKAEVDCSCVEVNYSKDEVKVGETAYIEISYNTAGEVGRQLKSVILYANTKRKKIELYINAEVENEMINIYS